MLPQPFAKVVASSSLLLTVVLCAGPATEGQTAPRTKTAPAGAPAEKAPSKAFMKKSAPAAPGALIDLNTASIAQLETLPGIGPAHAREIVANRPYRSVADLARVKGLGQARIDAIRSRVTVGSATPAPAATTKTATAPAPAATTAAPAPRTAATKPAAKKAARPPLGRKVNLNTASKDELDALPGIGPVRAQAIIDNRPFKAIEDVKRVKGIKDVEFGRIRDLITVE